MKKRTALFALFSVIALIALAVVLIAAASRIGAASAASSKSASGYPVSINEIMASNDSYYNADGFACDWIELFNSADYAIDLSGFRLSDNNRRIRYTFPDGARIPAGGYYVIYCMKNQTAGDYADFAIAKAGGESILLMNSRSVMVDSVVTVAMARDEAMARSAADEWTLLPFGTPGFANDEAGRSAYLVSIGAKDFSVCISEIMAINGGYPDPAGKLTDWVELYNAGSADAALSGYRLSDRTNRDGYVFPEGTVLRSGAYLVIYCDGSLTDAGYAPFSISGAGGESVFLMDRNGTVILECAVRAQQKNESQIRGADGAWTRCVRPTPGYPNTDAGYEAYLAAVNPEGFDVRISEVMAVNTATITDADGDFSDWIELANCGQKSVDLAGYGLSDRPDDPMRYLLPAVTLAPGERIVIFASGKERYDADEPHANFSLDARTETLSLATPLGQTVSVFTYAGLTDDRSAAMDEGTGAIAFTDRPTPGYPNTDAGYAAFQNAAVPLGALVISEVSPRNGTLLIEDDAIFDWVELENRSGVSLRLSDYYLTDSLKEKLRWQLPDLVLPAGGRIVILCTGTDTASVFHFEHVSISIGSDADTLYLFDADAKTVDFIRVHSVPYDKSMGRLRDAGGVFYFDAPTPGQANKNGCRSVAPMPEADVPGGVYGASPITVALSGADDIRYTTDGSIPTIQSTRYHAPLTFSESTVLRAICVADGCLPSPVRTVSYILTDVHTLPVLSVATEPDNLYNKSTGISSAQNMYDRSVERTAHAEFFSEEGTFTLDCGIKLHGASTRARGVNAKRSFKLTFRPRYDAAAPLAFPLFPGNEARSFDSVLLRNGEDYSRAFVRDEILSDIAIDASPELMAQDSRYCVLYINGHYEGIYCLKEAYSSGYYATHYGVSKESVEMQRGYVQDNTALRALMDYALSHDMANPEYYAVVTAQVNIESLIDWCIFEAYSANRDIGVNIRYYRSTEEGNLWRYALLDLDFGLHRNATFEYVLHNTAHGNLPRRLLDNPDFRELFLRRFAFLMQNVLTEDAVWARYQTLRQTVADEMGRERARWPQEAGNVWENYLAVLEARIRADRCAQLQQSLADELHLPLADITRYFGEAHDE